MFSCTCTRSTLVFLFAIAASAPAHLLHAAMDPRFELSPKALEEASAPKEAGRTGKHAARHRPRPGGGHVPHNGTTYVIKAGDNLHKILVRSFGVTVNQAEALIGEICRRNNIGDIRRLKVGQRIEIPAVGSTAKDSGATGADRGPGAPALPVAGKTFSLPMPSPAARDEEETLRRIKGAWDRIVPPQSDLAKPLTLHSPHFTLTLDPQRYPMFAAMDGGRIVVDRTNGIPPLIRTLIEEKEPSVRIVSETPANAGQLWAAMLEAGGFYSVEENFDLEFGADPKLTVHSDFKIEKTADSLVNQDAVLLNNARQPLSPAVRGLLRSEGFTVFEPFAAPRPLIVRPARIIRQVGGLPQPELVDAVLAALAVAPERDRSLDVFGADNSGISLSVRADRSFVRGGQRYVINRFDGDAVTYTLFRLLEAKGYRVITLDRQDDFRRSTEKILAGMKIRGSYDRHDLIREEGLPYSVQMSGFWLDDPSLPGGSLFLTDLAVDRVVRSLLLEHGFDIPTR
ncbi:LysM peptidoglycan-binding domain-containing protein [Geobacter sp. FeAm09]|uniref:LysM peptidoglycan-binding domain-containing protein n=1 Tax=Geobacter sp. FeAm09 TaxID=2597769 RepID=UPI0011ED1EDD|nr:LysM domain-containing protein [Geobacter sp. FeAm09]QEM68031.1 LysM peptidoglycan-binding domain-containing protein [Geobacter sp. FeAm09]